MIPRSVRPILERITTLLDVKRICVSYGPLQVLHDVDLHVNEREIVCVLGHNAAGKTTVINAILGLVRITSGEIAFQGERIDRLPTNKIVSRGFSMVPENGQVFTSLTVLEDS